MIKVLIVDDRITVQEILKSHLETESSLEILDCARNGQQALEIVEIHRPQIILMDIEMPVLDGLTATKIISERFVDCNVIIISVHDEENYLNIALQVGAKGYLLKNTPAKELINAVYSAYKGYFQLGPGLLEKYLHKLGKSQNDLQEITQLKTMMLQQSQFLEEIQDKRGNSSHVTNDRSHDLIKDKYISLEQKCYSLKYRLDALARKIEFIQQLCYFLIIILAILILTIILIS